MLEYRIVLCTIDSIKNANELAHNLVKARLAACVNIVSGVTSVYEWENAICEENEYLLIIKTKSDLYKKLETKIIPQLELDYKIINDKFVQYENKKAQNEKLAIEVAKLEKDLSKYETLQKLSQELDNTVKENDINNQNIEKLNNDLNKSKIIQEKLKKLPKKFGS